MTAYTLPRAGAAALLLAAATTTALAHAVVTKASLNEQAVVAHTATEVTLQFNSRIEPGFTQIVLIDAAGAERVLEVTKRGDPVKVTVALPALAAGQYVLRYKVLAADGHVTENRLRFTVAPAP